MVNIPLSENSPRSENSLTHMRSKFDDTVFDLFPQLYDEQFPKELPTGFRTMIGHEEVLSFFLHAEVGYTRAFLRGYINGKGLEDHVKDINFGLHRSKEWLLDQTPRHFNINSVDFEETVAYIRRYVDICFSNTDYVDQWAMYKDMFDNPEKYKE